MKAVRTRECGAPKIHEKLGRLQREIQLRAISTVHAVLDRHGLVRRGRRTCYHAHGTGLSTPTRPNDLWCPDYKGEFMLADRRYCYPLKITDFASRHLTAAPTLTLVADEARAAVNPLSCAGVRINASTRPPVATPVQPYAVCEGVDSVKRGAHRRRDPDKDVVLSTH